MKLVSTLRDYTNEFSPFLDWKVGAGKMLPVGSC